MECPRYNAQRAILFRDIGARVTPFNDMQVAEQFHLILGKRTGNLTLDNVIDRMVKRRLKKFWNLRAPISRAVNDTLGTSYWVAGALFKSGRTDS
jgi:hypothetical protein